MPMRANLILDKAKHFGMRLGPVEPPAGSILGDGVHNAGAVTYQKWIINSVIFNIDGSGENSACIQKLFACPTPLGKGIGGRRED